MDQHCICVDYVCLPIIFQRSNPNHYSCLKIICNRYTIISMQKAILYPYPCEQHEAVTSPCSQSARNEASPDTSRERSHTVHPVSLALVTDKIIGGQQVVNKSSA